jgi:tetratricopeptide (TPR) repeat protein
VKIAEIEAKIANGDCSEEMLCLFKTALKHVPKIGRCQHCYTTAASMPSHFHSQAISLIQYGLAQHCDNWLDRMRSYHNIAIILEANGDYVGAKQAYRDALNSIEADNQSGYVSEYSAHMMRAEMHINNFECTDDLEKYYKTAVQADEFSQSFQKKKFYRLLAEIIIFCKRNDLARAKEAFVAANDMLQPGFLGPITLLLKRKGFIESTGATKAALTFLRRVKRVF